MLDIACSDDLHLVVVSLQYELATFVEVDGSPLNLLDIRFGPQLHPYLLSDGAGVFLHLS